MSVFGRLRLYHSALGGLAALAYLSEDWTRLHVLIGYGVIALLGLRLLSLLLFHRLLPRPAWMLRAEDHQPKLGLRNPLISKAFIAGIMLATSLTVTTGLLLDQSQTKPTEITSLSLVSPAQADEPRTSERRKSRTGKKILKEIHEASANGIFLLAGLHVAYLLLMNRRYALRMLFLDKH